jgi:hypothetical protein
MSADRRGYDAEVADHRKKIVNIDGEYTEKQGYS